MVEYLLWVVSIPLQKAKKADYLLCHNGKPIALDAKIDKTLSKIEQISALRTCGSASNSRIIDLSNYRKKKTHPLTPKNYD